MTPPSLRRALRYYTPPDLRPTDPSVRAAEALARHGTIGPPITLTDALRQQPAPTRLQFLLDALAGLVVPGAMRRGRSTTLAPGRQVVTGVPQAISDPYSGTMERPAPPIPAAPTDVRPALPALPRRPALPGVRARPARPAQPAFPADPISLGQTRDAPPIPHPDAFTIAARTESQRQQILDFLRNPPPGLTEQQLLDMRAEYGPMASLPLTHNPVLASQRLLALIRGGSLESPSETGRPPLPLSAAARLEALRFSQEDLPAPLNTQRIDRRTQRTLDEPFEGPATRQSSTYALHPFAESRPGIERGQFNPDIPTTSARSEMAGTGWRTTTGVPPAAPSSGAQNPKARPGGGRFYKPEWQVIGARMARPGEQAQVTTTRDGQPMGWVSQPIKLPDGSIVTDARFAPKDFNWQKAARLDEPLPPDQVALLIQFFSSAKKPAPTGAVNRALNKLGITTSDRQKVQEALRAGTLPTDVPAGVLLETLNAYLGNQAGFRAFSQLGYTHGMGAHRRAFKQPAGGGTPGTTQFPTGHTYVRRFPTAPTEPDPATLPFNPLGQRFPQ